MSSLRIVAPLELQLFLMIGADPSERKACACLVPVRHAAAVPLVRPMQWSVARDTALFTFSTSSMRPSVAFVRNKALQGFVIITQRNY